MSDPEARFEALVARLREQECRLTPQRVALLRILAASDEHPSASQLYDRLHAQFPTTSLGTIYKTISLLKNLDEVLELSVGEDHHYDGKRPHPHPHLICVRCRKIEDAEVSSAHELVRQVAQQSGYKITSNRFDFYGLCPDCQEGG